jgi:hypothetical protein
MANYSFISGSAPVVAAGGPAITWNFSDSVSKATISVASCPNASRTRGAASAGGRGGPGVPSPWRRAGGLG